MITAILGGVLFTTLCTMFYIDDRTGGGLYDPDPSASYRYKQQKKK